MVQLAGTVVAPAYQGQYLAGVGIEGHQSNLGLGARKIFGFVFTLGDFYLASAKLFDLGIDLTNTDVHRIGGHSLQAGVERGVDAIAIAIELIFVVFAQQLLADEVYKVGSITGFHILGRQLKRRSFGDIRLGASDGAGLHHGFQDQIAPLQSSIRMFVGIEHAGALNQSRQKGGFGDGKLFQVLAEIGLGSLAKASNGERSPLAHIHLVGVQLENLLFGKALL